MLVSKMKLSQNTDNSSPTNSIEGDKFAFLWRRKSISDLAIV